MINQNNCMTAKEISDRPQIHGVDSHQSELELQTSNLQQSLQFLASNIEQLQVRLHPVLRSIPVADIPFDKLPEPTSSLGSFIHDSTRHVNELNNKISQLLQASAV